MIGSRPVVGSSKINISGFWSIALASPIRFWTPIERLDGNSLRIDFGKETSSRTSRKSLL